jgi:hypothetical protein
LQQFAVLVQDARAVLISLYLSLLNELSQQRVCFRRQQFRVCLDNPSRGGPKNIVSSIL